MTNEVSKEKIKAQLPNLLLEMGINPRKKFKCLNPGHDDSNPSMSYNKKKLNVHCFSCGTTYDTFDLVGLRYNLIDSKEIFKKAFELYQDKPNSYTDRSLETKSEVDYSNYFDECHSNISNTDYPSFRGLTELSINKFKLGYDNQLLVKVEDVNKIWKTLIIPTSKYSYVSRNTDENADKSERIRKCGENRIFNLEAFRESNEPIFIVEGEIDAMSIYECNHYAIALGSTSNIYKFVNYLKENKPKQKIILCLDNDTEGRNAQEKLEKALEMNSIEYKTADITQGHKDANESLVSDKEAFKNGLDEVVNIDPLKKEKDTYFKDNSAFSFINAFKKKINESVNNKPIPTQFKQLDDVLDGGLYEGLYVIGAVSSLGKTTFILQIADQIARNGQDVMIFSLEMSKYELMAKSISRITFNYTQKNKINPFHAKTIRGITNGDLYKNYNEIDKEVILNSILEYETFSNKLYLFEGEQDMGVKKINEVVDTHVRMTGNKPIVIIDYLQILEPYNERFSDKQNTDKSTLELKRMSRTYKMPVIVISSFNRSSYKEVVSMESFKESGAIEYSSDVLMGLQFTNMKKDIKEDEMNELKKSETRDITLRILKNRSGMISDVKFGYKTKYSYFYEVTD